MSSIASTLDRTRIGTAATKFGLTVTPLHLDGPQHVPDYVPLGEAVGAGGARITEISEGGSVPLLAIRNEWDLAVLILDGEELIGAKQNRIVNLSILVPGRSVLPIPVSCVEHGRWSYRTRGFDVSPNTFFAGGRAGNMQAVTMCLNSNGQRYGDQARVWRDVQERATAAGTRSPTEAMKDIYDDRHVSIEEIVRGLQPSADQAGAVFAIGGRVVGMELFETPAMYAAYYRKVARSYALDAIVRPAHGDFRASDADDFLAELRSANPRRFKAIGLGDDLRIDAPGVVGGALVLGDRLVHLAAFRAPGAPMDAPQERSGLETDPPYASAEFPGLRPPSLDRGSWLERIRRWFSV